MTRDDIQLLSWFPEKDEKAGFILAPISHTLSLLTCDRLCDMTDLTDQTIDSTMCSPDTNGLHGPYMGKRSSQGYPSYLMVLV